MKKRRGQPRNEAERRSQTANEGDLQYEGRYPVLMAVADDEGMLSAWCPHCQKLHHHGRGEGHRGAHCHDPRSPFKESGYVLRLPKGGAT